MLIKTTFSVLFAILLFSTTTAQRKNQLSKNIVSSTYDISGYTAIDVSDDFNVVLNYTATESPISLKANENLMKYVHIAKEGETLVVKLDKMGYTWFNGNMTLDLTINTAGIITDFKVSGDAELRVKDPVKVDALDLEVRGDGVFKATIATTKLYLTGKSDAEIYLDGSVTTMTANLASDSELKARDLSIENLTINLRGDSEASVTVSKNLDVTATGDSELRYAGNPSKIRQSARGDSDIVSMN